MYIPKYSDVAKLYAGNRRIIIGYFSMYGRVYAVYTGA